MQIAGATALFYTHVQQLSKVADGKTTEINTTFGSFKDVTNTQDILLPWFYEDKDQNDEDTALLILTLNHEHTVCNTNKTIADRTSYHLLISRIGRYLLFCNFKFHC